MNINELLKEKIMNQEIFDIIKSDYYNGMFDTLVSYDFKVVDRKKYWLLDCYWLTIIVLKNHKDFLITDNAIGLRRCFEDYVILEIEEDLCCSDYGLFKIKEDKIIKIKN